MDEITATLLFLLCGLTYALQGAWRKPSG